MDERLYPCTVKVVSKPDTCIAKICPLSSVWCCATCDEECNMRCSQIKEAAGDA